MTADGSDGNSQDRGHRMLFLYAETNLHPGAAESVGTVDQPIQRTTTRLPFIQQGSVKGSLKSFLRQGCRAANRDGAWVTELFGDDPPARGAASSPAAAKLQPLEASLVAWPIPTWREGFAWVTSPALLAHLARMMSLSVGLPDGVKSSLERLNPGKGLCVPKSGWAPLVLAGDYELQMTESMDAAAWASWLADCALPGHATFDYFRNKMRSDLLVLDDELLVDLTVEFSVKHTRVRLMEDQKTVAKGALWVEEFVPRDTLLAAPQIVVDDGADLSQFDAALTSGDGAVFPIGGHAGFVWGQLVGSQGKISRPVAGDS